MDTGFEIGDTGRGRCLNCENPAEKLLNVLENVEHQVVEVDGSFRRKVYDQVVPEDVMTYEVVQPPQGNHRGRNAEMRGVENPGEGLLVEH